MPAPPPPLHAASAARHTHLGRVGVAGGAASGIGRSVGIGGTAITGNTHAGGVGEASSTATGSWRLIGVAPAATGHTHPC